MGEPTARAVSCEAEHGQSRHRSSLRCCAFCGRRCCLLLALLLLEVEACCRRCKLCRRHPLEEGRRPRQLLLGGAGDVGLGPAQGGAGRVGSAEAVGPLQCCPRPRGRL